MDPFCSWTTLLNAATILFAFFSWFPQVAAGKAAAPGRLQLRLVPMSSEPEVVVSASPVLAAASAASAASASTFSTPPALWDNTLTFGINGTPVTLTNPDPTMHLVDYIRDVAMLKGTKVWCPRQFPVLCTCQPEPCTLDSSGDRSYVGCVMLWCQVGCYEGGCGACTVVLSWQDSTGG